LLRFTMVGGSGTVFSLVMAALLLRLHVGTAWRR
jgi:putative flippase GtrA